MGVKLVSASAGSVEIVAPATASNYTATMPAGSGTVVVNGVGGSIVSGTAVASTSGTSIDFTGIPSWVKRITVMWSGVSTNGTSNPLIQLGDSGGIEATGYLANSSDYTGSAAYTTGFGIYSGQPTNVVHGVVTFALLNASTNTWACSGAINNSYANYVMSMAGSKSLSDTLDRVRVTTVNGTDAFDAGSINILYE